MEHEIISRLRQDTLTARKAGDRIAVQALQSLLTRITNAEAVSTTSKSSEMAAGVGATEVARKELSDQEVTAVMQAELHDIQSTLKDMAAYADHPYTQELQAKAEVIKRYL